ncbi:Uncharacterised protein [Vibrio cholerae]|nr:Uncharacterised protein [Vibrio cholerae]
MTQQNDLIDAVLVDCRNRLSCRLDGVHKRSITVWGGNIGHLINRQAKDSNSFTLRLFLNPACMALKRIITVDFRVAPQTQRFAVSFL